MRIPNQFDNIIQKGLNVFAAWMPIVNKYKLGDYGIFADGVFAKLGNITDDFGVTFTVGGGTEADINFTSEGASVVRTNAGVGVDVIPEGAINANIDIKFGREKSFLVQSPSIAVTDITNVNQVAKSLKATGNWDGQWKVVHQVYTAKDPVIIVTLANDTTLSFSGDATALGKFNLGGLGVNVDTDKTLGLKIHGKDGVIGLGLFKIKSKLFGGFKVGILAEDDDEDNDDPIFLKPNNATDTDL